MNRKIEKIITGVKSSDGDGVQLTRIIASPKLDMLDPFLLMDAFGSDKPLDYIWWVSSATRTVVLKQ